MSTVATTRDIYPHFLDQPGHSSVEVQARYRGVLIGTCHLVGQPRARRPDRRRGYTVGAGPGVDAPAPVEVIGGEALPLLSPWSGGYLVNTTPAMRGELRVGGKLIRLQDYVRERGRSFNLPDAGATHIECGEMTFEVQRTPAPEAVPRPWWSLRWAEHKYTLGALAGLGLLLVLALFAPPEPAAISDGALTVRDAVRISAIAIPKVEPQLPPTLEHKRGDVGQAHEGKPGAMGGEKPSKARGRWRLTGRAAEPRMSKERSADLARNAGVLGFLNNQHSAFASILSRDMAVGSDRETVLSGLVGTDLGAAMGVNGLGPTGTGAGGGGTGQATLGVGNLARLGHLGRGIKGDGSDYGRFAGQLKPRRPGGLHIIPGIVTTRGNLDKEIVRRIIRAHMNEVKFCYEQELSRKADLAGRISVQFSISPMGQVIASAMQSTTMGNPRVESCVVNAVKRWAFPKPQGGGLVMVLYPFSFAPAGG